MKFKMFLFFKKDCFEIMQKFYSHLNLNLTYKKIIHESKPSFGPFSNFSFLFLNATRKTSGK